MGTSGKVDRLDSQVAQPVACRLLDLIPHSKIVGTAQPLASPLRKCTTAPRTRDEHKYLL